MSIAGYKNVTIYHRHFDRPHADRQTLWQVIVRTIHVYVYHSGIMLHGSLMFYIHKINTQSYTEQRFILTLGNGIHPRINIGPLHGNHNNM